MVRTPPALPVHGLSWLLLFPLVGCLVLPPVTHTAGAREVDSIRAGDDTRRSVRSKLGKPNVLELAQVYAWDWQVNRGTVVVGGPGAMYAWEPKGDAFRVLVRFEGDRVSSVEHFHLARAEAERPIQPPPVPPEEGDAKGAIRFEQGGWEFALDPQGALRVKAPGAPEPVPALPPPPAPSDAPGLPQSLAVSPDGRLVAVLRDGDVRIWDTGLNRPGAIVPAVRHSDRIPPSEWRWYRTSTTAFLAGGRRLLVCDQRSGLRMLDTSDWRVLWEWKSHFEAPPVAAPDGSRVLILGGFLLILDGESGQIRGEVEMRWLERWFNIYMNQDWGLFRLRILDDDTVLACGPSTEERWSLPEVERRWRETKKPARIGKDAVEPALLSVRLRPFPSREPAPAAKGPP
ncbi:MAG TPA: hypothetical protein VJ570_04600 [Holophagaceae bacterium]|nr:hypothetical protein [Holophagaceae bacterium]